MEKWDMYDLHRQKIGKFAYRGDELNANEYHQVIHVCIFNENGEMLIQQRQSTKEGWPNLWDVTCGGSSLAGETSQQAASRELFEELGIRYDFENIRPNLTLNFRRGFDDFYLVQQEIDVSALQLQAEEVQAAKWATEQQIIDMINARTFIPYYESLIRFLFASVGDYGAINDKEKW